MSLVPSTPSRPGRVRRRAVLRWIKRGALGAAGLLIAAAIVRAWLPKPVAVEVAAARRTSLVVEVAEDGLTRVRDRFIVAAPIAGAVRRIELDPGAAVEAGAVLARIDASAPPLLDERSRREAAARLDAALAHQRRALAAVAGASAARGAAVREAARARNLEQRGVIATADRDQAELAEQLAVRDLAAAEADRAAAVADAAAARALLEGGEARAGTAVVPVTAPIRGRVLRVVRQSAGPVAAGAPLVELGDTRAMEVVVDVLSSDAAKVRPGMPCAIDAWGGDASLSGEVLRVEPSAFTRISALGIEEQRVNVIVGLADPPPALGDGFRIEARIAIWRGQDVLAVPASAVFRDHDRWAVYAIEGGRARLRPIELGHRGRLDVEVTGGLPEGAEIVLHPSDSIRDGAKVVRAR
jgi:HlyD family secretion protein